MLMPVMALLLGNVSGESFLATPAPQFGAAQDHSAVATDGARYLVVWHDHRNGEQGSVWGRFVSAAGTREATEFDVLTTPGHKELGDVEFDGTQFFVALHFNGVVLQRVTPAGRTLDPVGIQVATDWSVSGPLRLATNGATTVVVWAENRSPLTEIRAARVTREGVVLDPGGVVVHSSMMAEVSQPDVAFDGTDFVVSYAEAPRSLFLVRLTPALSVKAPGPQLIHTAAAGELYAPRLNCAAGPAVVSFLLGADYHQLRPYVVQGQPGATPVQLSMDRVHKYYTPVELQLAGTNYLAAWAQPDDSTLRATRLTPALVPSDPGGRVLAMDVGGRGYGLAVGPGGAALIGWQAGDRERVLKGVLPAGAMSLSGIEPVTEVAASQTDPSLAVVGSTSLHTWLTPRLPDGVMVQLAARSVASTTVVDVTSPTSSATAPSIAASDTEALVTWMSGGSILARRYSLAGVALDAQPLSICPSSSDSSYDPIVAFDGAQFVIGFLREPHPKTLRVATVSRAGVVGMSCGQPVTTMAPNTDYRRFRVAAAAGTTVFVWEERDPSWDPSVRVVRTRGATAVDMTPLRFAPGIGEDPDVAWSGNDFVVAWSDGRRVYADVRVTRLPPTGAPPFPNGLVVSALDVHQRSPRLAFDGRRALLVWVDQRTGQDDLRGAFLPMDLSPSTDDFVIAASLDPENGAQVGVASPGRFVVAYTRFDRTPGISALRSAVRDVVSLEPGEACLADGECPSGFCVDGVCCESACGGGASDCQACSVAAGAPSNGVCSVLPAATVCRAAASSCDVAEVCDGSSRTCGADLLGADGLACNDGAGQCRAGVCRTDAAPRFTSPVSVALTCGERWRYSSAGRPTVSGQGPFTFSARNASGGELPDDFLIDPMTGELSWQTRRDSPATLLVELRVDGPAGHDTQVVQLDVECQLREHRVGCAVGLHGPLVLAALFVLRRRRRVPHPWVLEDMTDR